MGEQLTNMTMPDFWNITLRWIYGLGIVTNENDFVELANKSASLPITKSTLDRWRKGTSTPRRSSLNFEIITSFMRFFFNYEKIEKANMQKKDTANSLDKYDRLSLLFMHLKNEGNYDCSDYERLVEEIHENEFADDKSSQKYNEIFEQIAKDMATAILSQPKKTIPTHDIKIQMDNFRTYCIGEGLSSGCSASYNSNSEKVSIHYDFSKTPADICSVVFFTPNIDLSVFNNSYLAFSIKSDIEIQCIIEIRGASVAGSNPDNQLLVSAHTETTEYKINLKEFVGTKDYSCISEVKIICTRSDIEIINLEIEHIRFINE